jgi:hypothetical protein
VLGSIPVLVAGRRLDLELWSTQPRSDAGSLDLMPIVVLLATGWLGQGARDAGLLGLDAYCWRLGGTWSLGA